MPKGANVLDIGCGAGFKANFLAEHGLNVTGMDFSEKMIEIARKEYPKINFIVGDVYELDSYPEKYDALFAQAMLLHIPKKDVLRILEKFKNKLNDNGIMYLAVKEVKSDGLEEKTVKENDYGYEYERFFSFFTLTEIREYLKKLEMKLLWSDVASSGRTNRIQVIAQK